jgi:hypothetical protein
MLNAPYFKRREIKNRALGAGRAMRSRSKKWGYPLDVLQYGHEGRFSRAKGEGSSGFVAAGEKGLLIIAQLKSDLIRHAPCKRALRSSFCILLAMLPSFVCPSYMNN